MIKKSKENHIIIGRFTSSVPDLYELTHNKKHEVRRIPSIKLKKHSTTNYVAIAVKGNEIFYSGRLHNTRDFFISINDNVKIILVLTYKEKYKILETIIDFNVKVHVLEELFPIFSSPSYYLPSNDKIELINQRIAWLHKKCIFEISLGAYSNKKYFYLISRKTRFKNTLDQYFAFTQPNGYQECFKALECRADRVILSVDYNSMYPSCMLDYFPDPKNLKYREIGALYYDKMPLDEGVYRVVLENCISDFFRNFHPFNYKLSMKNYFINIRKHDKVEILLHKCEIEAYAKFFEHVYLINGIVSNSTYHPLKSKIQSLYNIKKSLKKQGNKIDYNFISFQLQTLHSSTNVKKYTTKKFNDRDSLFRYLNNNFMLNITDKTTVIEIKKLFNGKYFSIYGDQNNIFLKHINFSSDFNIHCFSSTIAAKARVKIFNTLFNSTKFHGTEICYVNVDSVHLSVLSHRREEFLTYMSPYISHNDEIGKMKVQCIASMGVWLDIGRYWLKQHCKVVMYKNKIFNHIGSHDPYIDNRVIKKVVSSSSFIYVQKTAKTIGNTLPFSKRLEFRCVDHAPLSRYDFEEVHNVHVAGKTYEEEKLLSKQFYIDLFNKTATN